jgi:guanyl-specific ribonuclease Sa
MKPNYGASAAAVALQSLNSIDPNNIQQSIQAYRVTQTANVVNPLMAAALSSSTLKIEFLQQDKDDKVGSNHEKELAKLNASEKLRLQRFKDNLAGAPLTELQKDALFVHMHSNYKVSEAYLDKLGIDNSQLTIGFIELSYNISVGEKSLIEVNNNFSGNPLTKILSLSILGDQFRNAAQNICNPAEPTTPVQTNVTSTGTTSSTQGGGNTIPDKAKDIANQVKSKNGAPPQGYKGGRAYNNQPINGGQKLPDNVQYKEYDINPYVKGQNRGAERIVIGDDGSVWYTNDHYQSFQRLE